MPTPSFQDVIKLLKAGATLEAQEKIIELREATMNLRDENVALRSELQSLKERLAELSQSTLPSCPRCGKPVFALKDSKEDDMMGSVGMFRRLYECVECGFSENRLEKGS